MTLPVVTLGDRYVHGWNPRGVADLLGVSYTEPQRLSPAELADRLDRILAGAQRAVRQVPANKIEMKVPGRDRTLRELGHHLFRLCAALPDAAEQAQLSYESLTEPPPAAMQDGEAIARYGETVRAKLRDWFSRTAGEIQGREVKTYYGPQSLAEVLERTTWHAAQHLRQLYVLLGSIGIEPDRRLTEEEFRGLPLPEAIW